MQLGRPIMNRYIQLMYNISDSNVLVVVGIERLGLTSEMQNWITKEKAIFPNPVLDYSLSSQKTQGKP